MYPNSFSFKFGTFVWERRHQLCMIFKFIFRERRLKNLSNFKESRPGNVSSFSASSVTFQRAHHVTELLEKLQKIKKIESSDQRWKILQDLSRLNDCLPCSDNPIDLMGNHISELESFAENEFVMILEEIFMKFEDEFEAIPEEILRFATITDCAKFPIQLMNCLNRKLIQKQPKLTTKLLERILRDDTYLIFAFTRASEKCLSDRTDGFIQDIISFPDKIGNNLRLDIPELLCPQAYSAKVSLTSLKTFHVICEVNKAEQSNIYDVKFLSMLMSRIFLSFRINDSVAKGFLGLIAALAEDVNYRENVKKFLMGLGRSAVEITAKIIFECFETDQIVLMIGELWKFNNHWKFALLTKLPLFNFSVSEKLAMNLALFLVREDLKEAERLFNKLLEIWSSKTHVNDTPFEQQFFVSMLMASLSGNLLIASDVRAALVNGVQQHIASIDTKVKALGMITSEKILRVADKNLNDDDKLKFDYSEFDDYIMNSVVNKIDQAGEIIKGEKVIEGNEKGCDKSIIERNLKILEDLAEGRKKLETVQSVSTRSIEIPALPKRQEAPLDSDDEDGSSSLDPEDYYPTPDESKRPRYLLDLIQAFTVKEHLDDPEKFEYSLQAASEIIVQQLSNHHVDIALDLIRILTNLEKTSYMKNFDEIKFKALTDICVVYPKESALLLCDLFNSDANKYSVTKRILMLNVLSETAKKLSQIQSPKTNETYEVTERTNQNHNKLLLKFNEDFRNSATFNAQEVIRQRLLKKSRKIVTKSKKSDEDAAVNRFSAVAGYFFFPLIQTYGRSQKIFKSHADQYDDLENLLIVKFLNTISVVLLCAENSMIAPKIAKEMMNLSVFLRYHKESRIRLATLHMIATVFLTIPRDVLSTQFSDEIIEFSNHLKLVVKSEVINYEADSECREFAKNLMSIFNEYM